MKLVRGQIGTTSGWSSHKSCFSLQENGWKNLGPVPLIPGAGPVSRLIGQCSGQKHSIQCYQERKKANTIQNTSKNLAWNGNQDKF